jgi:hypothetical protein
MSLWEYAANRKSPWMAMVFDDYRNLVAQEFENTQEAVHREVQCEIRRQGPGDLQLSEVCSLY